MVSPAARRCRRNAGEGTAEGAGDRRRDDRRAGPRLRAPVAGRTEVPSDRAGLQPSDDRQERPPGRTGGRADGRSVPRPPDRPDRPRHGNGHRVCRAGDGCRPVAQVPELARDADLHEGPDRLRVAPLQAAHPEGRLHRARRRLLRLRPGDAGEPGARRCDLRNGADAPTGADPAKVRLEDRPQLRPGRGRAGGRRAVE